MSKTLEITNSSGGITPTSSSSSSASDCKKQIGKKVPNYLRSSTGSCHDLCKYGHKNPSEEKQKLAVGRRKKLPTHLNNLALLRSVTLDRSKDVRNRNLSLAKSSISLGEDDRIANKITPANLRGAASSEHLVPHTASSADRKNLKSDGRKKHPVVAQRTPANPRYSNGVPKFDQKATMPEKGLKLAEKSLQEKARTVEKATTVKQSLLKRPSSFPSKQVPVPSQASSHVVSSKNKSTLKGKLTSPPATITRERASNNGKTGSTPKRSSNANVNGKKGLDISRTSFPMKSELTASVEIKDDAQGSCITGHNVESTLAELSSEAAEYVDRSRPVPEDTSRFTSENGLDMSRTSISTESELTVSIDRQEADVQSSCVTSHNVESTLSELSLDATEYVDKSRPEAEETSRSISEDDELEIIEKREALAAEFPVGCIIALELQKSLDDQELKTAIKSELTASVEIEDDVQGSCITGHNVESTLAELSSDVSEYVDKSRPAQEETSRSTSEDGLVMSRTSFSMESELTVSIDIQEDDVQSSCVTGHDVESTLSEMSLDATGYVDKSRPATEERSRSISEDDGVEIIDKSEALAAEFPAESIITLELQKSLDDQEVKTVLSKSDLEHILAEQNAIDSRASMDEDIRTDDAALRQLFEQLTSVENAYVYDSVLTESSSGIEADGVKVNANVESPITESSEEVGAHEDLKGSPELLPLDEKRAEDPESCVHCTSGIVAENVKADEIVEVRNINRTCHGQSISETSWDGELLEEPKSVLIEPIDSNVQTDELASVDNDGTFGQDELKSRIVVQQLPEELSDDEFYEEYDFELSESDESAAEDEGATIYTNVDESSKANGQKPRRISALRPDGASATPYKLKFKRGKIVELTPDSNGPRRLKFRRRAANEVANGGGQSSRMIYKRNSTNNGGPTNPDLESPGVKLRHQDAQDKKDAQGLFNNVIEETASKLVESRKSKVKALVGAFETVISLQDGNPTPSTPQAGNSPYSVHDDEQKAPEEAA